MREVYVCMQLGTTAATRSTCSERKCANRDAGIPNARIPALAMQAIVVVLFSMYRPHDYVPSKGDRSPVCIE